MGCDACSERINGKGGKTINTNATKQFLISSPPAVLILHLKRFQVGPRCMFRKMTKHVSFPFTLDLAPFCASKVKTLPNVHRYQRKLIYSLYGIVEHSGGMYGGHYVAYVKVRMNFLSLFFLILFEKNIPILSKGEAKSNSRWSTLEILAERKQSGTRSDWWTGMFNFNLNEE